MKAFKRKSLKMSYKRAVISGNTCYNSLLTLLKTLGILVVITIILYLVFQVAKSGSTAETESATAIEILQNAAKNNYNSKELLEILFSVITIVASSYACVQIHLMKDINRTEMCHEIYKADQEYRMQTEAAKTELKLLVEKVKEENITFESEQMLHDNKKDSAFQNLFLKKDFENLRAFAYHYEYIGYLTLRDKLNFSVAFDTITFPNWLMISDDAEFIRALGRIDTPDFWNGSEYLYRSYEVRRKYNAYKKAASQQKKLKQNYKDACKAWEEKYSQLA